MLKLTILFVNFKGHNRTRMNGWLCIFYGPLVVIFCYFAATFSIRVLLRQSVVIITIVAQASVTMVYMILFCF